MRRDRQWRDDRRARGVGRLHLDVDELAKVVHVERRVDLPAARRRIFAVPHRHQRIGLDVLEDRRGALDQRSEEHTSELQSLMRISYAVFCLKKKIKYTTQTNTKHYNANVNR